MRNNCFLWATRRYFSLLGDWLREGRPVGREPHVWTRPSRLGPWWIHHHGVVHYVGGRRVLESWVPVNKAPLKWWQSWQVLWFVGTVEVIELELVDTAPGALTGE